MDIIFGFGRRLAMLYLFFSISIHQHYSGRICVGKHLAHSTITLAAASVLTTFDLLRKVDDHGVEIEPKKEYKGPGIL